MGELQNRLQAHGKQKQVNTSSLTERKTLKYLSTEKHWTCKQRMDYCSLNGPHACWSLNRFNSDEEKENRACDTCEELKRLQ
jgi:hypothetical protein